MKPPPPPLSKRSAGQRNEALTPNLKFKTLESFRRVALSLANAVDEKQLSGIVFASPTRGQGATTVAYHVARDLDRDFGLKPLLVEVNVYRPMYARAFGLDVRRSIEKVGAGECSVEDAIQEIPGGLSVIPAEGANGEASTRLAIQGLQKVKETVNDRFPILIIDGPPILSAIDSIAAGRVVGHVLLVVAAGQSPREALARVRKELDENKVVLFGTILNKHKRFIPGWFYRFIR